MYTHVCTHTKHYQIKSKLIMHVKKQNRSTKDFRFVPSKIELKEILIFQLLMSFSQIEFEDNYKGLTSKCYFLFNNFFYIIKMFKKNFKI